MSVRLPPLVSSPASAGRRPSSTVARPPTVGAMGYRIEIQSNPHDHEPPAYSERPDVDNVDTVMIPDDGPEARLLHEMLGMVMTRGGSLDKDEAADLHESLERCRERLGHEKTSAPVGSPLRADSDDQG